MAKSKPTYGKFSNGMENVSFGTGGKVLLLFFGGPGNALPKGSEYSLIMKPFESLAKDFTVYGMSRKSNLPSEYTTVDMAKDCAEVITQDFNGKVFGIIGMSYGGMILQHFAAMFPHLASKYIMLGAAYTVSEIGKEIDYEYARLISEEQYGKAFAKIAEAIYPKGFKQTLFKMIFRIIGPAMKGTPSPTYGQDIMIEAKAEVNHDGSESLRKISVPILLLDGDQDLYFPPTLLKKTADLIPNATLELIKGKGHDGITSKKAVENLTQYLQSE